MNWSVSQEYKDILDGRYTRTKTDANSGSKSDGSNRKSPSSPRSSNSPGKGLITCPHCGREQTNRRFCSLCGGAIL